MTETRTLGQSIAFPPRIEDGRWAWSSGSENIRESMEVTLLTNLEERVMLPEFGGGLREFLFRPNTVATRTLIRERVVRVLARWEPRIDVQNVSVEADPKDGYRAIMEISYKLRRTGDIQRVTLNLQFAV